VQMIQNFQHGAVFVVARPGVDHHGTTVIVDSPIILIDSAPPVEN
jgi:hypothetical protein